MISYLLKTSEIHFLHYIKKKINSLHYLVISTVTLKYGTDTKIENFLNFMIENYFLPCITEPTRIVEGNRPTHVDNIFLKNTYEPCGNILEKIPYDHLPSFAIFESKKSTNVKRFTQIRDMTHFNQANYQHVLTSLNLKDYPQLSSNEMTQLFHKYFMNAYNKHAPLKYLSKRASKTKLKPWLIKGILISIKVKQHLFKMYKKYTE